MICPKCIRSLHPYCTTKGGCNACHPISQDEAPDVSLLPTDSGNESDNESLLESLGLEKTGKLNASLKDPQSTGRKRAAKLYPLSKNLPCEWQGVLHAGGGQVPIMGCVAGKQQARHHGPDYNTLNNDPGNVHRICHTCHNSFHAANDQFKDATYLTLYGIDVKAEDLSKAAKDLKSGGYQTKGTNAGL